MDGGEDRAFDRRRNRLVRQIAALRQRVRELRAADVVAASEGFLRAGEDLRQDHTGVAARTHERSVRRGRGAVRAPRIGATCRDDGGADRVQHVRAGVAVGDGIHVEAIDVIDLRREASFARLERAQQRFSVKTLCYDDIES